LIKGLILQIIPYLYLITSYLISSSLFIIPIDIKLLELETVTKDFLKLNPDIIFTHADKGNVLKKIFTLIKNEMLSDTDMK